MYGGCTMMEVIHKMFFHNTYLQAIRLLIDKDFQYTFLIDILIYFKCTFV